MNRPWKQLFYYIQPNRYACNFLNWTYIFHSCWKGRYSFSCLYIQTYFVEDLTLKFHLFSESPQDQLKINSLSPSPELIHLFFQYVFTEEDNVSGIHQTLMLLDCQVSGYVSDLSSSIRL